MGNFDSFNLNMIAFDARSVIPVNIRDSFMDNWTKKFSKNIDSDLGGVATC